MAGFSLRHVKGTTISVEVHTQYIVNTPVFSTQNQSPSYWYAEVSSLPKPIRGTQGIWKTGRETWEDSGFREIIHRVLFLFVCLYLTPQREKPSLDRTLLSLNDQKFLLQFPNPPYNYSTKPVDHRSVILNKKYHRNGGVEGKMAKNGLPLYSDANNGSGQAPAPFAGHPESQTPLNLSRTRSAPFNSLSHHTEAKLSQSK